jgi:hypothetical protein
VEKCEIAVSNDRRPGSVSDDRRERAELDRVRQRLIAMFSPVIPPEEVERCVLDVAASLEHARVRTFIPVLVERTSAEHLRRAFRSIDPPGEASPGQSASAPPPAQPEVVSARARASWRPRVAARRAAFRG